jgi:hypothetical protein
MVDLAVGPRARFMRVAVVLQVCALSKQWVESIAVNLGRQVVLA